MTHNMTKEQRRAILKALADGQCVREIARRCGVTKRALGRFLLQIKQEANP